MIVHAEVQGQEKDLGSNESAKETGGMTVGGPPWKDLSKRKKAVGDMVVTGRPLGPMEEQASRPK